MRMFAELLCVSTGDTRVNRIGTGLLGSVGSINLFNYTFEVAKSAMSLGLLARQKHLGVLWARRRLHEILWILFGSMMLVGSRQK